MNWYKQQKKSSKKLELSWWQPKGRNGRWRGEKNGKRKVFNYPNTKVGYEAALQDWYLYLRQLDGDREHAKEYKYHRTELNKCLNWYNDYGVPDDEEAAYQQLIQFLARLDEAEKQPELVFIDTLIQGSKTINGKRDRSENAFIMAFWGKKDFGSANWELPLRWQDRIALLKNVAPKKLPQTIDYWFEAYLNRVEKRGGKFIKERSAKDRRLKLTHFKDFANLKDHITTIDEAYLEDYHSTLDEFVSPKTNQTVSRTTKVDYFSVFRMFVRWSSQQRLCELEPPANLDSKEFTFREPKGTGRVRQEKKKMLWSVEEFTDGIEELPAPYPCFLMLMLNCAFRHIDISELRWSDLHLNEERIIIQRNKLNQQASAPVVSYKLWDKTVQLIEETKSDDAEFVFTNSTGGQVEGSIKTWWGRKRENYNLKGKTLEYIRKTGSTIICQIDRQLDEVYLGETLSSTAKIHYSFTDGEPCQDLDDGIAKLGHQFGYCEPPSLKMEVTPEMMKVLEDAGLM